MVIPLVPLPAQVERPSGRWEIMLRGPASTGQSGELRFGVEQSLILLETADTAWSPLSRLRITAESIFFGVSGSELEFAGERDPERIRGIVSLEGFPAYEWQAWPIPPDLDRWPVHPRLIISQILLGHEDTTVVIPGPWVAALPGREQLGEDYRRLIQSLRLPEASPEETNFPDRIALGLDSATRSAGRELLDRISLRLGADSQFRRIFGSTGSLRFDLHDQAMHEARRRSASFRLIDAARAIAALNALPPDADSLTILSSAWRIWNQSGRDSMMVRQAVAELRKEDPQGANSLTMLLAGYDVAERWWLEAVSFLLRTPWLEDQAEILSPTALVARFWGMDSLAPPRVETRRFGGYEAYAIGALGDLGSAVVRAGNAPAVEWLQRHGVEGALEPWRRISGETDSLAIISGGREIRLASPGGWGRIHQGTFLPQHDLLQIDPGIAPVFALTTVIHEWQHLLFTQRRARLPARTGPFGLHLQDDDAWLAEGAAEWATEQVLAGDGRERELLRLVEVAKRYSLDQQDEEDPHALGYRLIMALAPRERSPAALRERIAIWMHDPQGLARSMDLVGNAGTPLKLYRPIDASVIPEIAYTWDARVADAVQRRLKVPPPFPER